MKRLRWATITSLAVSTFVLSITVPVSSEASGRWGRRFARPAAPMVERAPPAPPVLPRSPLFAPISPELRHDPARYYQSVHPKYQSGFHARDMQNLGIPTGDIGLRGNGIFWTPW
jgi:hypothetical protein